jgi:hypothetical protein
MKRWVDSAQKHQIRSIKLPKNPFLSQKHQFMHKNDCPKTHFYLFKTAHNKDLNSRVIINCYGLGKA